MKLNATVEAVTQRIRTRSEGTRRAYLSQIDVAAQRRPGVQRLGCANVAHAFAGMPGNDKLRVVTERAPNIGIVTAFNDMLSAHAPLQQYPELIKAEARRHGATGAGGRWCARHVRWGDAGYAGDGIEPVFAGCDRHGNGGITQS